MRVFSLSGTLRRKALNDPQGVCHPAGARLVKKVRTCRVRREAVAETEVRVDQLPARARLLQLVAQLADVDVDRGADLRYGSPQMDR